MNPLNKRAARGSALAFAMAILIAVSLIAAFYLKSATRRIEIVNASAGRELMTEEVKAHMKLFQDALGACLDGLMNETSDDPFCPRTAIASTVTPAEFTNYLKSKIYQRYQIHDIDFECMSNCSTDNGFDAFPKVFRSRHVQIASNNTRVMLRQMLEYSRQTVNDFAQLVMAQESPFVIAPGSYDGKMGIQWGSENLQPDPQNPGSPGHPAPPPNSNEVVVKFNNTGDPIEFRDALLLSNMSISNIGNYDPTNPVGPRFAEGIIPDVPRAKISQLVQNMEELINEPYAIGDIPGAVPPSVGGGDGGGGGSGGGGGRAGDGPGRFTVRDVRATFVSEYENNEGWNPSPNVLSQSVSNVLLLKVGGNPNCIDLVRTVTFRCAPGTACSPPLEIHPIPAADRCLTDRAVVYVNGPVTVKASSGHTTEAPHYPFTILSRGTLTLMNSIVRDPNVDATSALMVMNGDLLIPDEARHRVDPSKNLYQFATQTPAPQGQTETGFEIASSMIVPSGRIVYPPNVMSLPNTRHAELGGIRTLGTTVVKELSPVSKQWTEGGTTYVQGFSFKNFKYDRKGLQSTANQFPGATIQSQGFRLVVTNETWDEQPSILTATSLLEETP